MSLTPALTRFLSDLRDNNERDWFTANKSRYETDVKEPALAFIRRMADALPQVSPHIEAVDKTQGGSLFRIYRDTRFSKDKTPYKTHCAMQFRHEETRNDVHAPGLYFHVEPGNAVVGAGMWGPDRDQLARLRDAIVADTSAFIELWDEMQSLGWSWYGDDVLKRGPKGYDPDHPAIEFLKRKSFAATRTVPIDDVFAEDFPDRLAGIYAEASPLMAFECEAVGLPY